jgi:S-adenosylmethionine-diacylglycerol 3-amino-3-carboxypropyl transferase
MTARTADGGRRATRPAGPPPSQAEASPRRITIPGAREDRLFFAQVREDPKVEIAALAPRPTDRVVVVTSGGCTALSLLAAGAGEVHAVDLNRAQNHLAELKLAAVRSLGRRTAIAFLGGLPGSAEGRLATYARLRGALTPGARDYWDGRPAAIRRGVLNAGVSERFIGLVAWLVRHVVHTPERIDRLLACRTLDEQRALFAREWNTRRWRWLFAALLNRWAMSRAYDPAFFTHVGRSNFAQHFRQLAEHALTEVPVADNYFLHQMLTGRYPVEHPDGVPPYLGEAGARAVAAGAARLTLVDGSVVAYLRTLADRSVNGIALSNVGEWMTPPEIGALFAEVERVAAPGARVVFRNFVGWTELPADCTRLVEDGAFGAALIWRDRSVVQPRVVVCRVAEDG